jgi:hypothetical protein
MSRPFACFLALLATAPFAAAQPQPGEPIPLTLRPAGPPSPASKYRLLPDGRDLVPGNAAALYYRSMAGFAENKALLDGIRGGQWDLWSNMPLDQLPRAEVYAQLSEQQYLLRQLDQAAHCRDCDWELAGRPEGIALLLPEVQTFRAVIRVVVVRARYELAAGHHAEALQALQAGYALAHGLGRGQTLIHVLVGAADAAILDRELEEIIQQPGAPNLYWALTVLPRPFLDPTPSIEEEGTLLERQWPALKRLEEGPMSPDQVHALRKDLRRTWPLFYRFPAATPMDYLAQTWDQTRAYPDARRALIDQGLAAEEVDAMPLLQAVALDAVRRYHRAWDDFVQWTHVSDFGREPGYKQSFDRLKRAAERVQHLVLFPMRLGPEYDFLSPPPLEKIYNAIARTDRRFEALRCVEAIRLYAANHGGRLPASLKDVTEVPIPIDPMTHKPFAYEAHGDRAKLAAPPLPDTPNPALRLSYEITLRP